MRIATKFKLYSAAFLVLALGACEKGAKNEIEGKGKNFVRINTADEVTPVLFTADAVVQTGYVAEVRRDANSASELQTAVNVRLAMDNTLLTDYNTASGEHFEALDPASYTIDPLDLNFAAGDFVKKLKLQLDPSSLDLSKQYALAFRIAEAGSGYNIREGQGTAIYRILITNQYHGSYHSNGFFSHPSSPRDIDKDKFLTTSGASSVETEFGDLGSSGWLMRLTVGSDNKVTLTPRGATNGTAQLMYDDPMYPNVYDPATKTFWIKYGYPFPDPTRIITEKITLK